MKLRDYQREALDALWNYFPKHTGNPLLVLPTGAGKSILIAKFIEEIHARWPKERVLVLTHVKELVEQNASKLRMLMDPYRVGIYSAGLGRRDAGRPVTVAGIQSVFRKAKALSPISIVIIDECHRVPMKSEGMYRKLLDELEERNEHLRIVGLSATPYRLRSGYLHKGEGRIFTDIAYDVPIQRLIDGGYLSPLRSKSGASEADLSSVKTRGGEFAAGELEAAMDDAALINDALDEVQKYASDRKKLLFFCAGVKHATHVTEALRARGTTAELVIGETPGGERDAIIKRYKDGKFRALVNVGVLTTGFDAPDIDCLVMMRPTKSASLYVQMAGRGMRIAPGKTDCLVLDFAGNILRHGPVDAISIEKTGKGKGEAPVRICPACRACVPIQLRECPDCGFEFPAPEREIHDRKATEAPILSSEIRDSFQEVQVSEVHYARHEKPGKPPSLRVSYRCGLVYYREWICLEHTGFARRKAERWWRRRTVEAVPATVDEALAQADLLRVPTSIVVDVAPKYPAIVTHKWERVEAAE
ncbi:MAG: DEAD/DEAH box helicase family protein [Myxococcota bacterium]